MRTQSTRRIPERAEATDCTVLADFTVFTAASSTLAIRIKLREA